MKEDILNERYTDEDQKHETHLCKYSMAEFDNSFTGNERLFVSSADLESHFEGKLDLVPIHFCNAGI